jgi:hypothetical protein
VPAVFLQQKQSKKPDFAHFAGNQHLGEIYPNTIQFIGDRRIHPDRTRNSSPAASRTGQEIHGETGAIREHRRADLKGKSSRIPAGPQEDQLEIGGPTNLARGEPGCPCRPGALRVSRQPASRHALLV